MHGVQELMHRRLVKLWAEPYTQTTFGLASHRMETSTSTTPQTCWVHGVNQSGYAVQELIRSGADDVKSKALQTAGNLAFCHENRSLLLEAEGFKEVIIRMADQGAVVKHEVRMSAIRALAILGKLLFLCCCCCCRCCCCCCFRLVCSMM